MSNNNDQHGVAGALVRNVLAPFAPPKWDLVGPTVNDDIQRAIQRYGAEAVKGAVKEATKAKRGRPREPDWSELREIIRADALEWLNGGDPFAARSNYAIAKEFAERNPGHSVVSTHKRIERKLSRGPYDRRWFTFMTAENLSREHFPFADHLRAIEAAANLPDSNTAEVWQWRLDRARSTVADYEAREGSAPDPSMSMTEIEEAVRQGGLAALIGPPKRGGMVGLASPLQQSSPGTLGSILGSAIDAAKD